MKGNDKSKEALDALRHSTSHVMAQAVQELFPGTKIAIGPVVEDGFYYDFDSEHRFTEEDFPAIEKRMRQIAEGNHALVRKDIGREESRKFWNSKDETYKVELLNELPEAVSHYEHSTWQDLCRGPHVDNTRAIRHFKLLSVAGAYWRGSEKNKMLQRIYGTAWATKDELADYLRRLEEAKKRDHRKLGAELGLFMTSELIGPGLPLWLPKGALVRSILDRYVVDLEREWGYQHVNTPHLARTELYKQSGHWAHFKDFMYPPLKFEDGEELVLRPMNCPHHITIFKHGLHSYRELPVRIAELGTMYRYERSGVLSGLSRVRAMTLNDAHIFCTADQIQAEVVGVLRLIERTYKDVGFSGHWYRLSLRDKKNTEKFVADDAMWERAEDGLRRALNEVGVGYVEAPGEAAYYGPKIDVQLSDVLGHSETISTVQLDFYLPERFSLEFVDADAQRKRPVMIHRGVLSTAERIMAFLIEHYAGRFPLWLAPVQVKVLTVTDGQHAPAREFSDKMRAAGLRVELDLRSEKIGHKVRDATLERVPYQVVIGPRDVEAGTLSVRLPAGKQLQGVDPAKFAARLGEEVAQKRTTSVFT